jgi:RimJ/RimL family protein N-acetyltransferase
LEGKLLEFLKFKRMVYKCLNHQEFNHLGYKVIPLREEDIYKIKDWRNSQLEVLRQKELLTDNMQKEYYNNVIKPTFNQEHPNQILFSYILNNKCIGYGGFVHISWEDKRAEVSFLVNTERIKKNQIYKSDFSAFLTLIKNIAFEELKFNRIFVETYSFREFHISILEENAFRYERKLRQNIIMKDLYYDSLLHSILKSEYNEK